MLRLLAIVAVALTATVAVSDAGAQSRRAPARKPAPVKKAPAPASITRVQATLTCPAELGLGVTTKRRFCDVLTAREPGEGILITIPPHRGPVTLSFELHNRHTYSEELIKAKQAFRAYTATIGVLSMDNTLIERAVVQSEFRSAGDLFDRIGGGAGPGGIKAVAPTGTEFVSMQLPEDVGTEVSVLGEKLAVVRQDGTDNFTAPGRPIATLSNVMVEYRPR